MSKNKMLRNPQKACSAKPQWIKGDDSNAAPRLYCTLRRKHGGKHQDGRGHQWDQIGRKR